MKVNGIFNETYVHELYGKPITRSIDIFVIVEVHCIIRGTCTHNRDTEKRPLQILDKAGYVMVFLNKGDH